MKKVTIVQRVLTHYRIPFFQGLKDSLANHDIELLLVYGQGNSADLSRNDSAELPWAYEIQNSYYHGGAVWQPCFKYCLDADLVIVENANRLLVNYLLQLRQFMGIQRFAFWGHGKNFQGGGVKEIAKKRLSRFAHWWFTYTEQGKKIVQLSGFPGHRITVVQNAIDSSSLIALKTNVTNEEVLHMREELQLGDSPVLLYCGGMYKEKLIPELISTAIELKNRSPTLQLILIGSGVNCHLADKASKEFPWIHYLGPLFGRDKILYYLLADYVWNPGAVGLAVLDSFALETPMITTEHPWHGPEFGYLETGRNGIVLKGKKEEWSSQLTHILSDSILKQKLVKGCKRDQERYSLDAMVNNFSHGILSALEIE